MIYECSTHSKIHRYNDSHAQNCYHPDFSMLLFSNMYSLAQNWYLHFHMEAYNERNSGTRVKTFH